jgi:hypothetical protein
VRSRMELGCKSKPFVCSSLKSASKSRQDEMRYTFNVANCDRIFDYLLQEKQIKLPSGHVIPLSEQLKKYVKDRRRRPEGVNGSQSKFLCKNWPMSQVQTPKLKSYMKVMNTPTNIIEMIPSKL